MKDDIIKMLVFISRFIGIKVTFYFYNRLWLFLFENEGKKGG